MRCTSATWPCWAERACGFGKRLPPVDLDKRLAHLHLDTYQILLEIHIKNPYISCTKDMCRCIQTTQVILPWLKTVLQLCLFADVVDKMINLTLLMGCPRPRGCGQTWLTCLLRMMFLDTTPKNCFCNCECNRGGPHW